MLIAILDTAVREWAPAWLELYAFPEIAVKLRAIPTIRTREDAAAISAVLKALDVETWKLAADTDDTDVAQSAWHAIASIQKACHVLGGASFNASPMDDAVKDRNRMRQAAEWLGEAARRMGQEASARRTLTQAMLCR
jgi:hypothetical protein